MVQPLMSGLPSSVTEEAANAESAFVQTRQIASHATSHALLLAMRQSVRGLKSIVKMPVVVVMSAADAMWGPPQIGRSHLPADIEVLTFCSPFRGLCLLGTLPYACRRH